MIRVCPGTGLLLALLLVGAHNAVLAHAYQHGPDALQNQSCPTCVTANQIGSGCIDFPAIGLAERHHSSNIIAHAVSYESFHTLSANQRGPPTSHPRFSDSQGHNART